MVELFYYFLLKLIEAIACKCTTDNTVRFKYLRVASYSTSSFLVFTRKGQETPEGECTQRVIGSRTYQ